MHSPLPQSLVLPHSRIHIRYPRCTDSSINYLVAYTYIHTNELPAKAKPRRATRSTRTTTPPNHVHHLPLRLRPPLRLPHPIRAPRWRSRSSRRGCGAYAGVFRWCVPLLPPLPTFVFEPCDENHPSLIIFPQISPASLPARRSESTRRTCL